MNQVSGNCNLNDSLNAKHKQEDQPAHVKRKVNRYFRVLVLDIYLLNLQGGDNHDDIPTLSARIEEKQKYRVDTRYTEKYSLIH